MWTGGEDLGNQVSEAESDCSSDVEFNPLRVSTEKQVKESSSKESKLSAITVLIRETSWGTGVDELEIFDPDGIRFKETEELEMFDPAGIRFKKTEELEIFDPAGIRFEKNEPLINSDTAGISFFMLLLFLLSEGNVQSSSKFMDPRI